MISPEKMKNIILDLCVATVSAMPRCTFIPSLLKVSPPAVLAAARYLVPPLTEGSRRKGAHGKVLILGGSPEYVGAPFYAGMASLRTGADLVWVVCAEGAGGPLKTLSPELMVLPLIPAQPSPAALAAALASLQPVLSRVHSLVIGPGLGRSEGALDFAAAVLQCAAARSPPLPTVLDADALFLLAQRPGLLASHPAVLLTPNAAEMERLKGLALGRGIVILRKDLLDCLLLTEEGLLSDEVPVLATVEGGGSPRRCGGQGDLLAGAAGTFLAWAAAAAEPPQLHPLGTSSIVAAAVGASCLVRTAAAKAFEASRRGMLTPDILAALPAAFEQCMEEEEEGEGGEAAGGNAAAQPAASTASH